MMNKQHSGRLAFFSTFLLILLLGSSLTSCGNLDRRLPKNEGRWNLETEHRIEIVNGNVVSDSTQTNLGTLIFNKDGTGQKFFSTDTIAIEWSFNKVTDQVTINQNSINFVYNVLENSADAQTWQNIAEIEAGGQTASVETTWDLKRE